MQRTRKNLDRLQQYKGTQDALKHDITKISASIKAKQDLSLAIEEANVLIQEVAKESQEKIQIQLTSLVTKAIQTIYPEAGYEFIMKFTSERGQTSVYPTLILGGNELSPLDNSGGMAEVIAFSLRIALIAIGKKPKVMLLDEPFTGVSAYRLPLVKEFIEQMAVDFGMQFVITTHLKELTENSDRSFRVYKEGNFSRVKVE